MCCSVMSDSLRPHKLWSPRLLYPWGLSRQEYWSGFPKGIPLGNTGLDFGPKATWPQSPCFTGCVHLILIKAPREGRSNTMIPILQMRKPRLWGYQLTQANPTQLVGGSVLIQTPTPGSNPIPVCWSRMCKKHLSEPVSEPWPLCWEPWQGQQSPTFWQLWPDC